MAHHNDCVRDVAEMDELAMVAESVAGLPSSDQLSREFQSHLRVFEKTLAKLRPKEREAFIFLFIHDADILLLKVTGAAMKRIIDRR